jgi:ribosomal-protein-alanine N-acetyltransferase
MIQCRALGKDDALAMAKLHELGFDHPWPEVDMTAQVDRDIVLGLGQPLSGFLIIRAADDQAELLTITIDLNLRQRGFARMLLAGGEAAAIDRGVDIMFLEVAEDNIAAIALYRALGYEPFGRRPAYYRRPHGRVAALTFRKQLPLDALPVGV